MILTHINIQSLTHDFFGAAGFDRMMESAPKSAIMAPKIWYIVGITPKNTAFSPIPTKACIYMIAVVGPARPFTTALRPTVAVNI